jgi:hypothetical protein
MKVISMLLVLILMGCNSPLDNMVSEEALEASKKELLEKEQDLPRVDKNYKFSIFAINVAAEWLEGPFSEPVNSSLKVTLTDLNGSLLRLDTEMYELGFNAFMPSMGHYLDDPGYFEELSKGVYVNSEIKFNMANDWRMDVIIFDADYNILDVVQWLEIL